ncbi:RHS repeat-associated core domain-containing protein [Pseudomonas gozinkensis]|uniref:RHS repeat-associated core domain-containing protein n=1 Tax=Pseudomonas gozinkensis TaxID=2774461 RepID=UPI0017883C4F|nr:RHS repeat-associated core domain-containing protein [Pseudomonas gozinkensis]
MNASVHWQTPSLAVSGPRGDAIRTVDYLRKVAGGAVQALVTRQQHDVAGRPVAQFDPRLAIPSTQTVFALNGQPLKTANVDAGVNVTLPGLTGESRKTWNANGNHRHITYDNQMRPIAVAENGTPDIETFTYAGGSAAPDYNLRGQLTRLTDASGSVEFKSYALTGQPLSETRTFTDAQTYTSQQVFSPLGAMLESTDAGGHQQQWIYDVAGQLILAHLQINGEAWQPILKGMRYNAEGKVIEQQSANDVTSSWVYDKANGRLRRQSAHKASGTVLKDDEYEDDPMGNIIGIHDLTYRPTYFRNQRVDGVRKFEYDSLSRLTRATGHDDAPPKDNPGRPQPTDPNDRCNFVQTYEMDDNGNLTCLTHVRDGNTYHYEMFVDPHSNRAVRWKKGNPTPDFNVEFDAAGNLLALQRGQPIQWNNRNQVQSVTLVEHAGGPPDAEQYRYSQGVRVHKRLETHSGAVSHFVDVRYLQNLQIRSKDNGERLHLITVATGVVQVTCLHWVNKRPVEIENNQLRYSLADHLGSTVMELDGSAQLISEETFSPYGGTATLAARSQIEVDYKFIRHSGQETDISGLSDYGARYYAPWLCRWISADPAGDVDGPNRYAYVSNNPLRYVDVTGGSKQEAQIRLASDFISTVGGFASQTNQVMNNVIQRKYRTRDLLANLVAETGKGVLGYEAGVQAAGFVDGILPSVPGVPYLGSGGLIGGNIAGDVTGAMADTIVNTVAERLGVTLGPLIPQTSTMSVDRINRSLGVGPPHKAINNWQDVKDQRLNPALDSLLNPEFVMNRIMASWISIIPGALNMFARAIETYDIGVGLDPVKLQKIETMYQEWQTAVAEHAAAYEDAFSRLGVDVIPATGRLQPAISLASLREETRATQADIAHGLRGIRAYREMNTTDSRFLRSQAHPDISFSRARNLWSKVRGWVA